MFRSWVKGIVSCRELQADGGHTAAMAETPVLAVVALLIQLFATPRAVLNFYV